MLLAWSSTRLKVCCLTGVQLRAAAGDQVAAAEDLLYLVTRAPMLRDLGSMQSVRLGVLAGNLTLSMDEVDMHAHTLSSDGVARSLPNRAPLPEHASTEALLVHDVHVRGRSVLRRAS